MVEEDDAEGDDDVKLAFVRERLVSIADHLLRVPLPLIRRSEALLMSDFDDVHQSQRIIHGKMRSR